MYCINPNLGYSVVAALKTIITRKSHPVSRMWPYLMVFILEKNIETMAMYALLGISLQWPKNKSVFLFLAQYFSIQREYKCREEEEQGGQHAVLGDHATASYRKPPERERLKDNAF